MTGDDHQNGPNRRLFQVTPHLTKKRTAGDGASECDILGITAISGRHNTLKRAEFGSKAAGFGRIRNGIERVRAQKWPKAAISTQRRSETFRKKPESARTCARGARLTPVSLRGSPRWRSRDPAREPVCPKAPTVIQSLVPG